MKRRTALVRRTDVSGNEPIAGPVTPPKALFDANDPDRAELVARLRNSLKDTAERARERTFWKWMMLGFGAFGWLAAGIGFAMAALIYMRQTEHHRFTVFNKDDTVAVYASTWDLPESKRENLILGTAAAYVRACIGYTFSEAQAMHDYCAGLSHGQRRAQYVEEVQKTNREAPQNVFGAWGWRKAETGRPVRTASNAIMVPSIVKAQRQGEKLVCARRIYRVTYVPVQALPTTLHMHSPTADIVFIGFSSDQDPNPLDPAACRP